MRFPVVKTSYSVKRVSLCLLVCIVVYCLVLVSHTKHAVIPIFVIRTYSYPNSKTFNGSDAVVTLFNGDSSYDYAAHGFTCWRQLKDGSVERSMGKFLNLAVSPELCKVGVMRLTCEFPMNSKEMTDYSVGVTLNDGTTHFQQLIVTEPKKTSYKFVSCMSRMIAAGDWAKFIMAMETFRYFGGDLAVAAVECAIPQLMKLARLYESDGILKIQHAFEPKPIPELNYNPLHFTEFASQIANAQECFYEFKESAEFISFPDWDDFLVSHPENPGPLKYYDMFSPLIQTQPNVASYSLERFDTTVHTPVHESVEFNLASILRKTQFHFKPHPLPPKIVIRPHLVASVWIHGASIFENKTYREEKMNTAAFAHVHYTILSKNRRLLSLPPGITNSSFVDPDAVDSNFRNMLERYSFEFKNSDYPFARLFYDLIADCYHKIAKNIAKHGTTYCPTTEGCIKYKTQNITVVKTKRTYKKTVTSGPFVWVEPRNEEFVTDNSGCL